MHVYCDFDGTISSIDTVDAILGQFAQPEWELIEEEWKRGEIGSGECMRQQIALIDASKQQLDDALEAMTIDPHFLAFVRFCESSAVPITVISDGVDYFITRILQRYGLAHLPVIANHLVAQPHNRFQLVSNYANPACSFAAGVCKCKQLRQCAGMTVFVGDGRSDFCAATSADMLFAKTSLATYCDQRSIAYTPYCSFADVERSLRQSLRREALPRIAFQPAIA